MGRRINPQRQSADHTIPGIAQGSGETFRICQSLCGGVAAADNRNGRAAQQFAPTFAIKQRRRVGCVQKVARIVCVSQSDEMIFCRVEPAQCGVDLGGDGRIIARAE